MKRNHVALFAGLGGFIVAANKAGYKTIFANDFEASCVSTLKATFPKTTISSTDIAKLSVEDELQGLDAIDLLSAGFPCQPFSGAGENLGYEDPRGQLFFEIIRLCRELPEPPKVLLLENVSMLKIFDNGARLAPIIQELRGLGYWVSTSNAMILNSKDLCGSPQNRERLFIVAYHSRYFKRNYFGAPLQNQSKPKSLWSLIDRNTKADDSHYLDEENKYARMIRRAAEQDGTERLYQIRRVMARTCPENTCPTLTANMGGGGHNVPFLIDDYGIRKLTIEECLKLQGYDEGEIIFPEGLTQNQKYTMIGNAIYPEVAEIIMKKIEYNNAQGSKNDRMVVPA